MTIREAFAKAGHPVMEGRPIFVAYCGKEINYANRPEWIAPSSSDGIHGYRFFLGAQHWMPDEPFSTSRGWIISRIDLSNLPAIDALDALPECVREVVQ